MSHSTNLTPEEQRALLVEEVAFLTEAIKVKGYYIKGSTKQDVLNPALAARRAALDAIRKLDAANRGNTDEVDELAAFLEERA